MRRWSRRGRRGPDGITAWRRRGAVPFALAAWLAASGVRGEPVPVLPGLAVNGGPGGGRVEVDGHRPPWTALARVQTELGARCTGFLLAPEVVETAAHCLFLPKVDRFIRPQDVHVLLGFDRGRFVAHARARLVRITPGYDPHREMQSLADDRAVLVLDHAVAAASVAVPVAPAMPPAGTALMLGGYDQDRAEVVLADPHCRLLGVANGVIRHDCAGTRGTSGAPLLALGRDGRWEAIGVQVAAEVAGRGGLAAVLPP